MNRRRVLAAIVASAACGRFARARSKLPIVAYLSPTSAESPPFDSVYWTFKKELARLGYRHGETVDIVERFANRDESRLPALAAELVALHPNVVFTHTSTAAEVVARATGTIPIVVGPAGEFVLNKLAGGNLARPTTNVTGVALTSPDIDSKSIGLLLEAIPTIHRIGVLVNPHNPGLKNYPAPQVSALGRPGLALIRLEASGSKDIDAALRVAAQQQVDALFVADDAQLTGGKSVPERMLRFANSARIPIVSSRQDLARAGALITMGPSIPALAARGASYVAKILEGARPADLPIELPSVLTVTVNLKTARSLGLTMPQALLARAHEVIQ